MIYQYTMEEINNKISILQDQVQDGLLKKRQLSHLRDDLMRAESDLQELKVQLAKEEQDVVKLNKMSLTNFYHTLVNDKSEKLAQEEREAVEAKLKVDRLSASLKAMRRDEERFTSTMPKIMDMEEDLKALFLIKKDIIQRDLPAIAGDIEALESSVQRDKMALKEINEAYEAGKEALKQVEKIEGSLQSAANWGTYDMLGGGLLSTMAKRGHLDDAQREMHEFQYKMQSFNRELKDVGATVSFDIDIDGFLSFADWFFDGFFVDWAVQNRINDARQQMVTLDGRLQGLIRRLKEEALQCRNRISSNEAKVQDMIEEV